jgi:hypothetical protein
MNRLAFLPLFFLAMMILYGGCGSSGPTDPLRVDEAGDAGIVGVGGEGRHFPIKYDPDSLALGVDVRDLPRWLDDEVLIVLHDGIDPASVFPTTKSLGLSLVQEIKLMWATVYRMHIDTAEPVEAMVEKLLQYPEVRYAEPNLILYPCNVPYYPNDPLFEYEDDPGYDPWDHALDQWGPNVLGASLCWPENKGIPEVVVAVLDTGYRFSHEDLDDLYWINEDEIPDNGIDDDGNDFVDDWRGWDFDQDDNYPWDNNGHGTACSGVVGAEQDNGVGCTGIAPGCKVMALRCDLMGSGGYTSSVIGGVQYAYDNGASIVSMSFRTYEDSEIMHNTFTAVYDNGNGLLPVGGAGNENSTALTYPACWPEVVEVGGTCSFFTSGDRKDVKRITPAYYGWGSNWGENLEVMAPGYLYITTHAGGNDDYWDGREHGTFGGTSCATPCAAACFGLLKSYRPSWTAAQLRQRLSETCDDLYTPGHDIESGWGRVNVWRAVYGSDPNADNYDINGHLPIPCDNSWEYDNIFDISTSADYDFEDIFVVGADRDGVLAVEIDVITTGENLDLELYISPEIGVPVAKSTGENDRFKPGETIHLLCKEGAKYYIRVFSPEPYNCSSYKVRAQVIDYIWWIDWDSLAPVFVKTGSQDVPLLKLDISTTLLVTLDSIRAYITGDIPLGLANNLRLYEDTNGTGVWEKSDDTLLKSVEPMLLSINQAIFDNLVAACTYKEPLTFFIVADIGPNMMGYNVEVGVGLQTYKDIAIWQDIPLREDPFPIFSNFTVLGQDHVPPEWDDAIGIQFVEPKYESVICYWNNATDELSEPTGYNIYWDDEYPPEISTGMMIEDVVFWDGGDYDHAGQVPGLENGKTYNFCVRAVDTEGNEEDNLVWLEGTPDDIADPENPELISELKLYGDSWEVWVHDRIAYVANGDAGVAIVDCTDPVNPVYVDSYSNPGCYGVQYHEGQDYVYASGENGLVIIDPNAPSGPELVGEYVTPDLLDVFVDGDTCYLGGIYGNLIVIDVTDPTGPLFLGETSMGSYQSVYGLAARDGYAYCCTASKGLRIVDATDPTDPHIVKTLNLNKYTYEIQLWGDYAMVTNWTNHRFFVIDISDPPNAYKAGEFNISGGWGAGVAVRNDQYVYIGRFPNAVWTLDWTDLGDIQQVGDVWTDGPDGLFFDGEFLYAAENQDGLKIIL